MNHTQIGYCLAVLFLFAACAVKKDRMEDEIPIHRIDYFSWEKKELKDFFHSKRISYILLKEDEQKISFGRVDKVKVMNDRIYISDKRLQVLVVYDLDGNYLGAVGKRGQGPCEYISVTDFDIDSSGNICMLDGRLDKIMFYNSDFDFIREEKLPFEVDILQFLDDKHLMCGLSSWNQGKNAGDKIVITDLNLNVADAYLKYDEYIDPAFWISDYQFTKSGSCIAYNQTISNHIYIFSHSGALERAIYFDFGKENVPDKAKLDIESKLSDYDHYSLLKKITAVTDNYVIGTLWEHRKTKVFVADLKNEICYLSNAINDADRNSLCGYCSDGIVSNITEESEAYPDSVNAHLRDEGSVLLIRSVD